MKRGLAAEKMGKYLYRGAVIILLAANIVVLARVGGLIYLPGELSPLEKARQGSQAVIKYSEELAASYGVEQQKGVIDILARFKYEVDRADSPEEVTSLMIDYGRQTQDIIFREAQNKRINNLLNIINNQELPVEGKITIIRADGLLKFLDPAGILGERVEEEIRALSLNQTLEIEIENRQARLVTGGDIFNQVDYLQTKIASLERQLKVLGQKAGLEPLSGSGIVIRVYDEGNENESTGLVHDSDIRNLINELTIAGTAGIEVGGQRLTVNSAVRCVGPTLLVNNKPIPVNPVVIKAVGEPGVLASSLDIIKNQLRAFGIRLEISREEEINLRGEEKFEG